MRFQLVRNNSLKIAVKTPSSREKPNGWDWSLTYQTLKHITANHPEIEFHFLFDSGIEKDFILRENVVPHNLLGWQGKQYAVVHDVNFKHRPDDLSFLIEIITNTLFLRQ